MTSLDMISEFYDSESEDDDLSHAQLQNVDAETLTVPKLPLPEKALSAIKDQFDVDESPTDHQGRMRSFKHERGNWATFVFIPYKCILSDELSIHAAELCTAFKNTHKTDLHWNLIADMHISLSRTVAIPHHYIDPLVESLQSKFDNLKKFSISFSAADLRFYVNDEKTRSFLGFEITYLDTKHILNQLVSKVDEVFTDFRCDKFYEEASYHFSIAWCLGDIIESLESDTYLKFFRKNWLKIEDTADYLFSFEVTEISLKCGNKVFNFYLK